MKKTTLLFLLICISTQLCSYAYNSPNEWNPKPQLHNIPKEYEKESAVIVLEREIVDYGREGNESYIFNTLHRIIRVQDDKGIESFNTVTVTNYGIEVRDIKARVIVPNGSVFETAKDKILESKSEKNKQEFVFALEGLEKGAEIEIMYTIKYPFSLFGSEYFQFSVPVLRAEFELKCPDVVIFETKGYNGFPSAKDSLNADTSSDFTRIYHCAVNNMPGIKEEKYSNYNANLMHIEYRIAYLPKSKPNQRQFTWNDLAKTIYQTNYNFTDKELKIVQAYLKSIGLDKSDSELEKVQKIEDALKKSITLSDEAKEENEAFDVIISKKTTNDDGFKRFFAACLTEAGVEHEMGTTSNRYNHMLDEKFENWKPLDYYLFYFPNLKTFLAPTVAVSRMPFVSTPFLNNKGVFCKITSLGSTKTAIATIRTIKPMPIEVTQQEIDATVSFKGDDFVPEVIHKQIYSGYSAMGVREAFLYTPKENTKELVGNLTDIASGLEDISSYKIENTEFNNYYTNKPLILTSTVTANKLIDKAGPNYLFKVGDVIGAQAEFYQTEKRMLPVDVAYPHSLPRHIRINIPEGYKVKNPEILNMDIAHKDAESKTILAFNSKYSFQGNQLLIEVNEVYDMTQLPVSDFEIFAKVINAAADFNKLVLILEKK